MDLLEPGGGGVFERGAGQSGPAVLQEEEHQLGKLQALGYFEDKVNVKKAKPSLTVNTSSLVLNKNIRIDAFLNVDAKDNVTFHIQGGS